VPHAVDLKLGPVLIGTDLELMKSAGRDARLPEACGLLLGAAGPRKTVLAGRQTLDWLKKYRISALPQAGTASALELVRERGTPPASKKETATMTKPNQTPLSANVNVLDEAQLQQVVGGNGRCGGYRKNYNHGHKNRRYNDCDNYGGGYESKGGEDSYESYEEKYDNYDHCERKYS